jgi:hypothetical protein
MKKKILGFAVLVAVLSVAAWAGEDVWRSKPYTQWTDDDITKVFNTSPWAKSVTVEGTWKHVVGVNGASGSLNAGGSGGAKGMGGGSGVLPAEADLASGTKGPDEPFNVYWISSETIRAALARKGILHGGKDPAEAQKYVEAPQDEYQVMVQGADMAPFYHQDEKFFTANAALEVKKTKQKVMPSHVVYGKDASGNIQAATFFFPKTVNGQNWLSTSDKNVEFTCLLGKSTLHAVFEPTKMINGKGPDL